MSVFNHISWPAFIVSFALGVFYIYISLPTRRVVTVYPTQDNADHFNFRDKAHNCFRFEQEAKPCPTNDDTLKTIPMQT
jgi:hypothetical protein